MQALQNARARECASGGCGGNVMLKGTGPRQEPDQAEPNRRNAHAISSLLEDVGSTPGREPEIGSFKHEACLFSKL
eukprot:6248819-Pyramimonas_sp.AAC.2